MEEEEFSIAQTNHSVQCGKKGEDGNIGRGREQEKSFCFCLMGPFLPILCGKQTYWRQWQANVMQQGQQSKKTNIRLTSCCVE